MGNYCEGEEEQFFDSREETSSVSDWGSTCSEDCSSSLDVDDDNVCSSSGYEIWTNDPESVSDRRRRFLKWMGWNSIPNPISGEMLDDESLDKVELGIHRVMDYSGAVLRSTGSEDGFLSNQNSMSSRSSEARGSFESGESDKGFMYLDNGKEFVVDELDNDGMLGRLREVGFNRSFRYEELRRSIGSSSLVQRFLSKYVVDDGGNMVEAKQKTKKSWLRKLSATARIPDRLGGAGLKVNYSESSVGAKMQRVKVYPSKKRCKELSSLYAGQEFLAHNGSILTMKFSLDGQYLATGGEDGVVRVWKVTEDERDRFDFPASDPSCLYFKVNHLSALASVDVDKQKIGALKGHRSLDSTCVVFPPKVFKVLEKPLHEFQGHSDEILDLSWSKRKFLLSSSVDKTVRLWQVGWDRCLRVFTHNNYVTCVDFNPVDDNYFISGSIDGKVRIWEVLRCRVVDYTNTREIVTALCYRPDGKGGIVGSMTGNCLFYNIIDNQLQLDAQICLQGKKKMPGKRITGFEFCPSDPSKVVVTSADSLVRVLCGMDVICKFKASGLRTAANQIYASFTSDGKHIVSTSEDSNVYVWNYNSQERTSSRLKKIRSCESFLSQNASVAIPWRGIKAVPEPLLSPISSTDVQDNGNKNGHNCPKSDGELNHKALHSPDCFSLTPRFLLESLTRGAATWPAEKLPDSSPTVSSIKLKSEFKFLKSACQSMFSSHMWGLVIVTAGWDGRIRVYLNYGLPLRS